MVPVPASMETVYRFLASQANSLCLFSFDPSMKFSPFFAVISTKFIHNRGVCVCVFSRFYRRFRKEWKVFTSQNRNNECTPQPPTMLLELFPSILAPLCSADSLLLTPSLFIPIQGGGFSIFVAWLHLTFALSDSPPSRSLSSSFPN